MNGFPNIFPRQELALLPTPVRPIPSIGDTLFMKEDSLSGPVYGGNKIRKLEFLLGEAMAEGRKTVITYGAAGSNHALATAVCCRQLGLRAISILAPQTASEHVRKNILMQHVTGAELHLCSDYTGFPEATKELTERCEAEDGLPPYIIPAGGSNATGALGFVAAALEMAEQIQPDVIYIPMGTGGTLAGLLVGLKLAGLKTRIEAVRVIDPAYRNEGHIRKLCREICEKMLSRQPHADEHADTAPMGFLHLLRDLHAEEKPLVNDSDIIIRDGFFGEGYGIATPEAEQAVQLFREKEDVCLETTYTGKTAAALLHDLRSGTLDGQTVLYWNTLNSRDFTAALSDVDFHDLPPAFHEYFKHR